MVVKNELKSTSIPVICTVFTNVLFWWNLFVQFSNLMAFGNISENSLLLGDTVLYKLNSGALCMVHNSEEGQKHASSSTKVLLISTSGLLFLCVLVSLGEML